MSLPDFSRARQRNEWTPAVSRPSARAATNWVATDKTFSGDLYKRFIAERQALLLKEIARLVDSKPGDEVDG